MIKKKTLHSYNSICDALKLNFSSFCRWKNRLENNKPLISPPGPKKVPLIDDTIFKSDLKGLKHCKKRSFGTTSLYNVYKTNISRREFQYIVSMARYDTNKSHKNNMRRIEWLAPSLVWSMDDTEFGRDANGAKQYFHNMADLSSAYTFKPIAGEFACGEGISANLEYHFEKYGAPLFMKRDNGGNLNHSLVNEVLQDYFVIPLNSPTYYPQYNGSIERNQYELKMEIKNKLTPFDTCSKVHLNAYSEAAIAEMNHKPRKKLKNKTACKVFFDNKDKFKFNKRERRSIYDWIIDKTNTIFVNMRDINKNSFQSAYRIAIETWLRMKQFISNFTYCYS